MDETLLSTTSNIRRPLPTWDKDTRTRRKVKMDELLDGWSLDLCDGSNHDALQDVHVCVSRRALSEGQKDATTSASDGRSQPGVETNGLFQSLVTDG